MLVSSLLVLILYFFAWKKCKQSAIGIGLGSLLALVPLFGPIIILMLTKHNLEYPFNRVVSRERVLKIIGVTKWILVILGIGFLTLSIYYVGKGISISSPNTIKVGISVLSYAISYLFWGVSLLTRSKD